MKPDLDALEKLVRGCTEGEWHVFNSDLTSRKKILQMIGYIRKLEKRIELADEYLRQYRDSEVGDE